MLLKYNTLLVTGTTAIRVPMIKRGVVDYAVGADWTPASGDVKVDVDGTISNITNLPTAVTEGNTALWEFILTAAETSGKSIRVVIADSATKAVEDNTLLFFTYGHASAMFAFDFSVATQPVNTTQFAGQAITAAAGVTIPASIASPTNITAATGIVLSGVTHTNAVIPTVTTVTNQLSAATISTQVAADLAVAHGAGSWLTATGFSTHSAADVWAVGTRTITGGSLTTSPPTAAVIADAVWDEARSGHVMAGTFGEKIAAELDSAALRATLGMSAADMDIQLDAILAATAGAGTGAGTGARTVTITVNDGTTVLQNAVVRFTEGANTYRALTNASGVATFNLDDATYTVAVSKVGYYYAGTTMIVNGTETATYSMTAINVTPGAGDLTTGYLTCLDEEGVAEQGVSVRCQVVQIPNSGTGFAYDSAVQLETSDVDGLVEFPMIKGARYLVWRGSIKPPQGITPVLVSASAGSTTALGSLIGE